MKNSYLSLCDDFYIDMYVNTELELPQNRDTILAFFERIQKQFPTMANFYRRGKEEYCLEEDRSKGQYRWVTLEKDRFGAGMVNCENLGDAFELQRLVIELAPYMLSVSSLDIDSLDVAMAMDFDYQGNHDEVIAEAFMDKTPFAAVFDSVCKPIDFSPSMVISLSEDMRTQARICVDSKTAVYEPGRKVADEEDEDEESITLSLAVRQYPLPSEKFNAAESFARQWKIALELMDEKVVPFFAKPLTDVITQKKMI